MINLNVNNLIFYFSKIINLIISNIYQIPDQSPFLSNLKYQN